MNAIVINLTLGVFWLFLGGAVLAAEWVQGPFGYRPLGVSLGWWALVLSVYNWVKASLAWYARTQRRAAVLEMERQYLALGRREQRRPSGPPDPNFKFTDEPPPSDFTAHPPADR